MRLPFTIALAAGFAGSAVAFVPSSLVSRASTTPFLTKVQHFTKTTVLDAAAGTGEDAAVEASDVTNKAKPAVFPGVSPPSGKVPDVIRIPAVVEDVFGKESFSANAAVFGAQMVGTPKDSDTIMDKIKNMLITKQGLDSYLPEPDEYKFFGNDDHSNNLLYLVKTNPFMASALTMTTKPGKDRFEIKSFDPNDPDCEGDKCTLYQKIIGTHNGSGHRVNIEFNSKMTRIRRVKVFDDTTGLPVLDTTDKEEIDQWAASAIYGLIFYASSIHATIHVLHYLLTAALQHSAEGFEELEQWANTYAAHIPEKYKQVGQVLIRDKPNQFANPMPELMANTYGILTGSAGFGASGTKLRPILQDLLNQWVKNPSNFLDGMMNIPADKREKTGILTEFMKHHDLISPFADEVTSALRGIHSDKFTIAELRTKMYLEESGIDSEIDTLKKWIELMAATGITHGSTLSYSRAVANPEVLKWRDIQSNEWTSPDVKLVFATLGTITGMQEGRHVFNPIVDQGLENANKEPFDNGTNYARELQNVLKKFDNEAFDLKVAHKEKIMEDSEEFNNFGWILSDFCPDGFDGKQLTITTYI